VETGFVFSVVRGSGTLRECLLCLSVYRLCSSFHAYHAYSSCVRSGAVHYQSPK